MALFLGVFALAPGLTRVPQGFVRVSRRDHGPDKGRQGPEEAMSERPQVKGGGSGRICRRSVRRHVHQARQCGNTGSGGGRAVPCAHHHRRQHRDSTHAAAFQEGQSLFAYVRLMSQTLDEPRRHSGRGEAPVKDAEFLGARGGGRGRFGGHSFSVSR
ncbi:hypothetical protein E2C01_067786 [Portunus trituberculatus]|uniref:Uncharacterized protein n=1 Tax=Portunus trituberculatus TaxID=210409 RepID=A0A5B7HUR5_PORTR|nr:hypothetical protein [Portunus trituberculatus]